MEGKGAVFIRQLFVMVVNIWWTFFRGRMFGVVKPSLVRLVLLLHLNVSLFIRVIFGLNMSHPKNNESD
jgi:hypothetical protein